MRPALVAGLVTLALPAAAVAQPGPYLAVVTADEVRISAGPSDSFPDTGKLKRGARVVVESEENGWLAITAPPGSVSWVPNSALGEEGVDPKQPRPLLVPTGQDTTLAAGRVGSAEPLLEFRRAKVPAGTILTVIGGPATIDGKKWHPVEPPPGDFRYIPKSAVQAERAVSTAFVVRGSETVSPAAASEPGGARPPVASVPGPGSQPPPAAPPKPAVDHPLWAKAEELEKEGRADEAEKVYFELARKMNEPGGNHDIANLCYSRIHSLREKKRASVPPAAVPAPPRDDRAALLPPVRDDRTPTVRPVSAGPDRGPPPADPQDNRPHWAGAGTLVRSALALDGRRTYALESSPGVPRLYVVPAREVDLERYVNRRVDVFGTTYTRRELSKPYMVVTDIQPNP